MQFEIVTIFPEFFTGPLDYGIVRRARESRIADVRVHDLRAFTHDRHRTVDDRPFGGGEGMVLKPEPLFEAVETLMGDGVPRRARERQFRYWFCGHGMPCPYNVKQHQPQGKVRPLFFSPHLENYFARMRRADLRNSTESSCCAAAMKEWTSV